MLTHPTLRNLTDNNYVNLHSSQNKLLLKLGAPHINSFNFMVRQGLKNAIDNINPVEFLIGDRKIKLVIVGHSLQHPQLHPGSVATKNYKIYPTECRQRHDTYSGKLMIDINWFIDGQMQQPFTKDLGNIPIMVKSNRCNLEMLNPEGLVEHGEHEQEWGGYFIVSGLEKIIRMLLIPRRNYPNAIKRPSWKQRGPLFSELGVSIRSVQEDGTSTTNVLHYLTDGSAKIMFSYFKQLYYIPICLLLKCLCNYTDWFIFQKLTNGFKHDLNFIQCCQNMLRALHTEGFHSHIDCKSYLGKMFKIKLWECPPWYTDTEVADFILKNCILIHLNSNEEKFNMLIFMLQKLFEFAQDDCISEGVDSVMMQEVLQGGYLYLQIVKESLQHWLHQLKKTLQLLSNNPKFTLSQSDILLAAKKLGGIDRSMALFLATGNIHSKTGLGVMQDKGLSIVAENINRTRYMSHFKAVHRGAFFQEMRTSEVRQLLPDAWGFICPVHTPDGAPCGLLNHLTLNCIITEAPDPRKIAEIPKIFINNGMVPVKQLKNSDVTNGYVVQIDGKILGYIAEGIASKIVNKLRLMKIEGMQIPTTLEIIFIPRKKLKSQFPGIYMFSSPSRMMRPVKNLHVNQIELIGTFEQVYLNIALNEQQIYKDKTTHMELSKTAFLSNLAQLIPMPDCNQSPRNMYQCQMSKQTMGTPCHTWHLQSDTKLYRLQSPSTPLFRPVHHDNLLLDNFAMGSNAVVAVISYTGYDMEDAMIINKGSEERGLCHGSIYKSELITLEQEDSYFTIGPDSEKILEFLDNDGLPYIGRKVRCDEPLYSYFNSDTSAYIVVKFKGKEECFIDAVKLCSGFQSKSKKSIIISFRLPRNPSVGDKFASRAGQKGICSRKWPVENLPFTETGLVPDIIFNPHGFPSRMTIAMMIELMAGKSAALHGLVHDATPFKFTENDTAINYFGRLLELGGYNYYGVETLYSGVDGREMEAMIFIGIVHYQRLRHMVSDKWQVRSTGPVDVVTHQPIKGRKKGGGVRFGEMERDALISHGIPFMLQDRLLNCSDEATIKICTLCGSILGPNIVGKKLNKFNAIKPEKICQLCEDEKNISSIQLPYMFNFFVTQLASCNVNVTLECKQF